MPSYFPTVPQPEPENKCPDCLYLALAGVPVPSPTPQYLELLPTSQPQPIHLHLTIQFNEQWELLPQGRIKFGLKGGELRLKLRNAEIPYESRQLSGSVELTPVPPQQNSPTPPPRSKTLTPTPNPTLPEISSEIVPTLTPSLTSESNTSAGVSVCQIIAKVSEDNPTWIFEEEKGQSVLKGALHHVKLATLEAIAFPCWVEATFEVSRRDVCLTDVEGLWPANVSRNKRAVLDQLIIQRLLEPKFKPYLSRAELHYDG